MAPLHYESRKISFIKGVTWRMVGTLDTIFLSWLFTGNISMALKIGGIELFTKIILFYLHDRAWIYFSIGKKEVKKSNGTIVLEDKHWRSFVKGISWRLFGTIDTITIAFFVTGEIQRAFEIGFTEVFTKLILFYIHERLWIKFTKPKGDLIPETGSVKP